MTAQKGISCLLKVESSPGSGTYTDVAGLKTTSLTINNTSVDATTKSSAGERKLLAGAGINSMSVSADGIFEDDAALAQVRSAAIANTDHLKFQFVFPGTTYNETYTGEFQITSFVQGGNHDAEMTFSISLESDGAITVS